MILKKVSFGIFRIILVSKEENNSATESKDKVLSLSKFSQHLVNDNVGIIKIRHLKGQNHFNTKINATLLLFFTTEFNLNEQV